jgi:uncharacterized membrane protein HdeD (DUF308 family)
MIFLPRLARILHHPWLAVLLGIILVGVGIYGLASADIPTFFSILIIVVGALNALRGVPQPSDTADPWSGSR